MYSFNLLRLAKRIQESYRSKLKSIAKEFNMSCMELEILLYLSDNPEKNTSGDICEYLCLKSAIVSFHVDRLVKDGYIERTTVEGDRRKYALILTDAAETVTGEARAGRNAYIEALNRGLGMDDREKMRDFFTILENNLSHIEERGR